MDAVEFLKAKNRICRGNDCYVCPIGNSNGGCRAGVAKNQESTEEELVQIVEKWSAEHPIKTRQSEFLKMFPNARLNECKSIAICPRIVDANFSECKDEGCSKCEKEYWLAEVE